MCRIDPNAPTPPPTAPTPPTPLGKRGYFPMCDMDATVNPGQPSTPTGMNTSIGGWDHGGEPIPFRAIDGSYSTSWGDVKPDSVTGGSPHIFQLTSPQPFDGYSFTSPPAYHHQGQNQYGDGAIHGGPPVAPSAWTLTCDGNEIASESSGLGPGGTGPVGSHWARRMNFHNNGALGTWPTWDHWDLGLHGYHMCLNQTYTCSVVQFRATGFIYTHGYIIQEFRLHPAVGVAPAPEHKFYPDYAAKGPSNPTMAGMHAKVCTCPSLSFRCSLPRARRTAANTVSLLWSLACAPHRPPPPRTVC